MDQRASSGNGGLERKVLPLATGTLGKAMAVLDIVASSEHPLRFTDILKRSGQPRGTLHRQLTHLVEEGLLKLDPDLSYSLGLRLLKFAWRAWAGNRFRAIAEPHLARLQAATGETVHLGVLSGSDVIYLDKVEGRQAVRMYSQIGNASPIYCTGVGKAAVSVMPDAALRVLVSSLPFHRFTENTLADAEALLAEIDDIRRRGVAFDREEHEPGIRCVAAPIFSEDRAFLAAVSVTGPAYRVSEAKLESWIGLVREAASTIMEEMRARLGPRG